MDIYTHCVDSYFRLKSLQTQSGLFIAAPCDKTGYSKAWFRDNIYEAMGLEAMHDWVSVEKTYKALFQILRKHIDKIKYACDHRPIEEFEYIHARYNHETFEEYHEGWGNAQHDMIGLFLFKVARLEHKLGLVEPNKDIIMLLVEYLCSCKYWEDKDNGMWEENREIHSSSVGNCLAGLKAISNFVYVPWHLIENGQKTLDELLPRESETKDCDLAQLSLIWPCEVVTENQKEQILKNIEERLVKTHGIMRYENDQYYYCNQEAEWVMGFPWLARIYSNTSVSEYYLNKTVKLMHNNSLPELYTNGNPNENNPLGWAEALFICAAKNY